ncbi:MAG: hypothetical protein JRI26_10090 [Deltaproteobacteria bacterium]|nr:hypothetical protein [Deltaproteobacteria bacterium]
MNKTGKDITCLTCGKVFYASGWQLKRGEGKFCSLGCRRHTDETKKKISENRKGTSSWNKGTKGMTKANKTSFKVGHSAGVRFGRDKDISGDKHWNWKGGITSLVMKVRNSKQTHEWRNAVFERDRYACQECGRVGWNLQADHIFPFSAIFKKYNIKNINDAMSCGELWDIDNGRTLCKECHMKTDTYLSGVKNFKGVANYDFE